MKYSTFPMWMNRTHQLKKNQLLKNVNKNKSSKLSAVWKKIIYFFSWLAIGISFQMALLKRPSGLLIDLSGTIHIEDKVVASSIEAIRILRHKRIPFLFVTNTTKVSFVLLMLSCCLCRNWTGHNINFQLIPLIEVTKYLLCRTLKVWIEPF